VAVNLFFFSFLLPANAPPLSSSPQIALQCLDKVAARPAAPPPSPGAAPGPAAPTRLTYTCDGHNVCFLLDAAGYSKSSGRGAGGRAGNEKQRARSPTLSTSPAPAYGAVCPAALGRAAPFALLDSVASDFVPRHGAAAGAAAAHAFDRVFSPRLAAAAAAAAAAAPPYGGAAGPSKVASVQRAVDGVKAVMVDNIEKVFGGGGAAAGGSAENKHKLNSNLLSFFPSLQVLERGERIELLVDKTDGLRDAAGRFQASGRALRQKMWWNVRGWGEGGGRGGVGRGVRRGRRARSVPTLPPPPPPPPPSFSSPQNVKVKLILALALAALVGIAVAVAKA